MCDLQDQLNAGQVQLLAAALNTTAGQVLVEGDTQISAQDQSKILLFPGGIANTSSGLDALDAKIQVECPFRFADSLSLPVFAMITLAVYMEPI